MNEGCLITGALTEMDDKNFDFVIADFVESEHLDSSNRKKGQQMFPEITNRLFSETLEAKEHIK